MLEKFVNYFIQRHLLTNMIFLAVLIGGIACWQGIKKEEMPDVTFDRVRISAAYPGATAEEVEHFVTKPLEEEVQGLDGVYRITSTASQGSTSITVEIEQDYPNKDEVITEIRSAVLDVDLPEDVRDKPSVRVFKTSKKAIIDIALINSDVHLLDVSGRQKLQEYAHALENLLLNLPEVNSINKSGYLKEELQIKVSPEKLLEYAIPLSQVLTEVRDSHVRQPAGHIEAQNEPKVTLNAQLDTIDKLDRQIIQAGFEGKAIALENMAEVTRGFNQSKEIIKVNGHEAVMFNVVKNSSAGILVSIDAVNRAVKAFRENQLKNSPFQVVLLDDESLDVRNRISIITMNGGIGFVLILLTLFVFLNKRSGLWVAMGIPFSICFTLIASKFLGYSINNITLAGVIIVMGMVVDDAIVVAENIGRFRSQGASSKDAAVQGTAQVFLPIVASIVTTCIAFVPLFYFSGRFGRLNAFIPPIIFLMLGASLFESLVILPGHMHFELPKVRSRVKKNHPAPNAAREHWFVRVEDAYGRLLCRVLPYKIAVLAFFSVLLVAAVVLANTTMKFVMFPNEETQEISVTGEAPEAADRFETARLTKEIEEILAPFVGRQIVGIRTEIARSRRGGAVEENKFRMIIEIVPKEKRRESADEFIALWKKDVDRIDGLKKLTVQKSRWGQSSGSAVEILVQQNDDALRAAAVEALVLQMKAQPALTNVDIERPIKIPEYKIGLQREKIKRLSISPQDIAATFRAALEGIVLYELPKGDEEVDVRLTVTDQAKTDMNRILAVPVENRNDYLVPLGDVVDIEETLTPNAISRQDRKRTTNVFADLKPDSKITPLEAALALEANVFPKIFALQPTTGLSFTGEVQDTRDSKGDFRNAVILVCLLIFAILAVLFNSISRPLIIMLAIPFGVVGVILAFWLHGKALFGFFAAIGVLGLAGVVINDSIVLLVKLDTELLPKGARATHAEIARVAQTRLRAVVLTTLTTVVGVLPTAYGLAGYDAMLAEMMLALAWGLCFGTLITLLLVPCAYSAMQGIQFGLKSVLEKL